MPAYSVTHKNCKTYGLPVQKCNSEVSCVVDGLGFRIQRLASRRLASDTDEALDVELLPGCRNGLDPRLCLAAFVGLLARCRSLLRNNLAALVLHETARCQTTRGLHLPC